MGWGVGEGHPRQRGQVVKGHERVSERLVRSRDSWRCLFLLLPRPSWASFSSHYQQHWALEVQSLAQGLPLPTTFWEWLFSYHYRKHQPCGGSHVWICRWDGPLLWSVTSSAVFTCAQPSISSGPREPSYILFPAKVWPRLLCYFLMSPPSISDLVLSPGVTSDPSCFQTPC